MEVGDVELGDVGRGEEGRASPSAEDMMDAVGERIVGVLGLEEGGGVFTDRSKISLESRNNFNK